MLEDILFLNKHKRETGNEVKPRPHYHILNSLQNKLSDSVSHNSQDKRQHISDNYIMNQYSFWMSISDNSIMKQYIYLLHYTNEV